MLMLPTWLSGPDQQLDLPNTEGARPGIRGESKAIHHVVHENGQGSLFYFRAPRPEVSRRERLKISSTYPCRIQ
jgi:hypothetical protein